MNATPWAPVVLFVYNRILHTKKTLESLRKNFLAKESTLYIYSDGGKNKEDQEKVDEVRSYIKGLTGFGEMKIIERESNLGLADSIVDGVTSVINRHNKVIVLEDDIVTSPFFLKFMNDALKHYEREKKVMHISGWTYPVRFKEKKSTFLWRVMNCWGWGTWRDRWALYRRDADHIYKTYNNDMIKAFDLDHSNIFWHQIINNKEGKIKTWAIFWYASIFSHKGLCLNPTKTYTLNIGRDGTGTNCGPRKILYRERALSKKAKNTFPDIFVESNDAVEKIKEYYEHEKEKSLNKHHFYKQNKKIH